MTKHHYSELTDALDEVINADDEVSSITVIVETDSKRVQLECVPVTIPVKYPRLEEIHGGAVH